jgi:hypothetical protein
MRLPSGGVLVATLLAAGACSSRPAVQVPQVQAVTRAIEEPRDRRAHVYNGCVTEASRVAGSEQQELIKCMEAQGFGLLARPAEHRRSHCLAAIEAPDRLPEAFCFQKVR